MSDSAAGDTKRLSGSVLMSDLGHTADGKAVAVKGALAAVGKGVGGVRLKEATEIRRGLRGSFDARVRVIEAMADGECVEKRQIHLKEVVPYVACPNCGEVGLSPKDEGSGMREVEVLSSVKPKERLVAMEILAKYGLGTLKEVSVENVRERVAKTVSLVRQMLAPAMADQVVEAMRPIWKDG